LSVRTIVVAYQGWGDVNQILGAYAELDRVDVDEALAYYEAHRDEIDAYIACDRAED
jgi:uncharacterized protein (DUF433 family)